MAGIPAAIMLTAEEWNGRNGRARVTFLETRSSALLTLWLSFHIPTSYVRWEFSLRYLSAILLFLL